MRFISRWGLILLMLVLIACRKEDQLVESDPPCISFHSRLCDTLVITPGLYDERLGYEEEGAHSLLLQVSNMLNGYDQNMIPGDKQMEEEITRYLNSFFPWYQPFGYPIDIEYRMEICSSISITSDDFIGNVPPGDELSGLFVFYVNDPSLKDHAFILSGQKKEWVGMIEDGMALDQYLSYEPFIFPYAGLRFKQDDLYAKNGTTITIIITFKGGGQVSSSIII